VGLNQQPDEAKSTDFCQREVLRESKQRMDVVAHAFDFPRRGICRAVKPVWEYNRAHESQEARMAEMIIRPTMKFIYLGYLLAIVIVVALVVGLMRIAWPPDVPLSFQRWIPWLPVLLLLWPVKRHLRNRLTKMTILDDRLRYETGFLSRTTRTILISRVQDVTVHQRLSQRILAVGDVSIETAGEASRLTIPDIDRPQGIADLINQHSQRKNSPDQLA
jgi:membrane protein YdbS with pleckstrin-like domain